MGNSNSLKKSEISVEIMIHYFEDKLNPDDQKIIEQFISTDADFANWIDTLYEGWLENPNNCLAELEQFKEGFFAQIGQEMKETPPWIISTSFFLRIAATVLILALVGIGVWKLFPNGTCQIGDFTCHIQQSEGIYQESITSAGNAEVEKRVRDFISSYKYRKFEEAIAFADFIDRNGPDLSSSLYEELLLCLGISYLHSSEFANAVSTFNKLLNDTPDNESIFKYEATWYLSLTYLKMDDLNNAKSTLTDLVSKSSPYSHHGLYAQKLLKRL